MNNVSSNFAMSVDRILYLGATKMTYSLCPQEKKIIKKERCFGEFKSFI